MSDNRGWGYALHEIDELGPVDPKPIRDHIAELERTIEDQLSEIDRLRQELRAWMWEVARLEAENAELDRKLQAWSEANGMLQMERDALRSAAILLVKWVEADSSVHPASSLGQQAQKVRALAEMRPEADDARS